MSADDPLMSAADVARLWGANPLVVASLVESQALPSLDRGELIGAGNLDVPVIRRSWAEYLRRSGPGNERVLSPPSGATLHPAIPMALRVHTALAEHDADELFEISSQASRANTDPQSLLSRWIAVLEGGFPEHSGVGSLAYSLAPLTAVGVRVFAHAPKVPRAVDKPTPALLLAVLPFLHENEEWHVDFPLFAGESDDAFYLPELITTPLPPLESGLEEEPAEGVGPPDGRPAPPR